MWLSLGWIGASRDLCEPQSAGRALRCHGMVRVVCTRTHRRAAGEASGEREVAWAARGWPMMPATWVAA